MEQSPFFEKEKSDEGRDFFFRCTGAGTTSSWASDGVRDLPHMLLAVKIGEGPAALERVLNEIGMSFLRSQHQFLQPRSHLEFFGIWKLA